jgi:hypothetical protein
VLNLLVDSFATPLTIFSNALFLFMLLLLLMLLMLLLMNLLLKMKLSNRSSLQLFNLGCLIIVVVVVAFNASNHFWALLLPQLTAASILYFGIFRIF